MISGTATAVVIATGDRTYIASIASELNKRKPLNAYENGVRRVSYCIIMFMACMVPVVIVLSGFSTGESVAGPGGVLSSLCRTDSSSDRHTDLRPAQIV